MQVIKWCLSCLAVCTLVGAKPTKVDFRSDEFIESINRLNTTWKAGRNFPEHMPLEAFKRLAGVIKGDKVPNVKAEEYPNDEPIPESFDSRDKWPNCPTIRQIRDQGNCGSCWAEAVTSFISDRICIQTGGNISVEISTEDMISCDEKDDGCNGGNPINALDYYVSDGLVSGGEYGTKQSCRPYTIEPCSHHIDSPLPPCPEKMDPTPECKRKCIPEYAKSYEKDLHYGKEYYSLGGEQIQQDIMKKGPVSAAFAVYEDFVHYKSGVYRHVSEELIGFHAVRIIGWGVENGDKYWLVANSWNEYWGDKGYFKVLRGVNECGIEDFILGATP